MHFGGTALICAKAPAPIITAYVNSEKGREYFYVNVEILLILWTLEREVWTGGLQSHVWNYYGKMALKHQPLIGLKQFSTCWCWVHPGGSDAWVPSCGQSFSCVLSGLRCGPALRILAPTPTQSSQG